MKKIILVSMACVFSLVACKKIDSLLDTTNYQAYDTSNFPKTEQDAEQVVTSIYNAMPMMYTSAENVAIFRNSVASDDMFGGGSTSNTGAQATDRLMEKGSDESQSNLKRSYQGIFRANYALEVIPEMEDALFSSVDYKNYLIGQAYFLRAWFYWELAEKFETFPLKKSTAVEILPRASAEECFEAIAEDLKTAIQTMPAKYGYTTDAGMAGRATKYAAEAVLARVWLFYTGFYGKSDLFGISKSDIIGYLKDVRDNSKFGLEKDPREIWPYTNEYSSGIAYGADFDTYPNHENLHWVGNRSKETVWACHFSLMHRSLGYNRIGEYYGLRNSASAPNALTYPYGIGYTNGTVNSKMVEEWFHDSDYGPADKRLWGSVFAVDNAAERMPWLNEPGGYVELAKHPGNDGKEVEKTMFHNKKYMVSVSYTDATKTGLTKNFFYSYNNAVDDHNQYGMRNDAIFVRFADVLLMLDELEETVTGMNQLRARAGLAPYSGYSIDRLRKERRYELCFEGTRFTDLRRWYRDQAGKVISDNQEGAFIEYLGNVVPGGWTNIKGNGIVERYAKTRGFWMLSNAEIELSDGALEQTPGFGPDDNWLFSNGDLPYPTKY